MKHRVILTALISLLVAGCATTPKQVPSIDADGPLLAAQQALDKQYLQALQLSVSNWMQAPCSEALWYQAYLDWMPWQASTVETISNVQLQFWPDKRDLIRQRLSPLPSGNWQTLAAPARGFSAAEYLLTQSNPESCQALALVVADINQQLAAMALSVQQLHNQQVASINAIPELYWQELLSEMNAQLARANKKLALPMNEIGNAKPFFAESWRIDMSLALLNASLEAIQTQWLAEMDAYVLQTDAILARRISLQFEQALLAVPKQSALAPELANSYGELLQLKFELNQLEQMFTVALPQVYGIVSGFNATDGD